MSYKEIKRHLESVDSISLGLGQFAADFIEETLETWNEREDHGLPVEEETAVGAFHYTVENILDVIRPDAPCYGFFKTLESMSKRVAPKSKCGICGGLQVLVRGRYPGDSKREVCPTCLAERLDQISDISARHYGQCASNEDSKQVTSL
jgi:hypothetical protein